MAESFIAFKETGKNKKTKLTYIEFHSGIYLKFFPSKNARTNQNLMIKKT